jgi:glycosyltransferase involved in cell wall biosynthesis
VPAGVQLLDFPFRRPDCEREHARLLFVGRQVPVKGLDVLLRALALVRAETPSAQLDVIGDGPRRREHEALARTLGVSDGVRFLGSRSSADVADALRAADLLVVPSRTTPDGQREGSPVITKEALAVGVPIVATRSGGISETIPPAQRSELVPEEDPGALAAGILARLADRSDWEDRALSGRAWVEQEFDWRVLGRRLANVYAAALEGA